MNKFKYTHDNKRYHTYNYFLKNKYQSKVAKVSLNAAFTCPNRDGSKGKGGCTFCSSLGSGDYAGNINDDLMKQFESQKEIMRRKWPDCKFIPYFQAYTNTYAPLNVLKELFTPFINKEDCVGLAIATRADCITEEIAAYLGELNKQTDIYIELGLQSIFDQTSLITNRCETYDDFKKGVALLRKYNLDICVHVINGLPYETKEMMIETVKQVSTLDIQGIKIHSLYICKNTTIYNQYVESPFPILSREEYIKIVCTQLRYIPEKIVIERLTGDAKVDDLYKPLWSINKTTILNDIDKLMYANDYYQGDLV